jgi:uncharacterized protein (TIGR03067 family)
MSPRIAVALLPLLLIAAAPDEAAVKKELKKLQGTWVATQTATTLEKGKRVKFTQNFRLVIRDEDRFTLSQKFSDEKEYKELVNGTLIIDPSKKPREMDMTYTDVNMASLCIYEFDGTTLKLLGGKPGGARPKAFDKERTLVFQRERRKK